MDIADTRRAQLKKWIDENYDGKPTQFAAAVSRKQPQIHDVLSGTKAFGEKLARKLEVEARMPRLYLDNVPLPPSKEAPMALFGVEIDRAGVLLGAEWGKLDLKDRIEIEQDIYARVAKKVRDKRKSTPSPRPSKEED
jgi:hypothetical protein